MDDVLIGARRSDPNGFNSGETYIVYGSSSAPLSGTINLSSADVTLNGIDLLDESSRAISAGDFNGDGVDDVLIGALTAAPNGNDSGEAYIVYGSSSAPLSGSINLSSADVTLNGIDVIDFSGEAVSSGDFNGDGVDDVLIGALNGRPNGTNSGETYIVYGGGSLSLSLIHI